jgi:hypothetical protein
MSRPPDSDVTGTPRRGAGRVDGSVPSGVTASPTNNSPLRQHQQQRVDSSLSCKGKRQKVCEKRDDATAPFDDIFLPSDEIGGRSESDADFDREIEEFKRFCYNSWLMQKHERQRVSLNVKDIFARKKSHQGCTS